MIDKVWTETHFRRGTKRGWAPRVGSRWCKWDPVGRAQVKPGYDARQRAESFSGFTAPGVLRSV